MAVQEGMELGEALELGPRVTDWLSPSRELATDDPGVATLALLSSRLEYWEAYSLAAAFVVEGGGDSAEIIARLAEGSTDPPPPDHRLLDALSALGETAWRDWSRSAPFVEWCASQPLDKLLSPPVVLFVAARDIRLAIPASALAAADPPWATLARCAREFPEGGPEFQRCVEEHG